MKNKLLVPLTVLPILALALAQAKANAALIELVPWGDSSPVGNNAYSISGDGREGTAVADLDIVTDIPQIGETSVVGPTGFVTSRYRFLDPGFTVSWEGSINNGGLLYNQTVLLFRPRIDLRYEFESSYTVSMAPPPGGDNIWFGASLAYVELRPRHDDEPTVIRTGIEFDEFVANGFSPQFFWNFSASGILPAGRDVLLTQFTQFSDEGNFTDPITGTGSWSLKLRPAVPDGGSTLAMLGMAIVTLGGMARLRAVCS